MNASATLSRLISRCGAVALLLLSWGGTAAAQVVRDPASESDVIEERIHREREEKERPVHRPPVIDREPERVEKPAPPAEVRFVLKEIQIEGNTTLPDKTFRPLIAEYQDHEIGVSDLIALADKIEKEYRKQGYLTTIAYVPPQRIEEGRAMIQVVEGKLGEVIVEGNRYFHTSLVKWYWRTKPGEVLRYQAMVKHLARMNKHPDRQVQAALRAGKETGQTDVILKVTEKLPMHAGGSWDRQGTKPIGRFRYGASVRHNNLLGFDDRFILGTVFGKEFGAVYTNYAVPVSPYGTTLMFQYTHSQASPKRQFKPFGVHGTSNTYTVAVIQSIFEKERWSLEAQAGLDFKESRTMVQADVSRRDRLRVLRIEPRFQVNDQWGRWSVTNEYAFGLKALGAMSENNLLASRPGADPDFFKFGMQVSRVQKMPWQTLAIFSFETQLSPSKLTPQEELYLGGSGSVRGYPEGDYLADMGFIARAEYHVPCRFLPEAWKLPLAKGRLRDQLRLLAFVDRGYGRLRAITAEERESRNLTGIGTGFQLQVDDHLSAKVEWGFNVGDDPLTDDSNHLFHVTFQFDF